jgi:hypothetical protein
VAEGFTCDVDYLDRFACEGLDFYGEHESKRYCVLHYPGEEKNKEDFLKVKRASLTGKTTFFAALSSPKVLQTLDEARSGSQDVEIHSLSLWRWGHAELLRQQASATLVDT